MKELFMFKKLLLIGAALHAATNWFAAGETMRALASTYALHNPKGTAQVHVKTCGKKNRSITWTVLYNTLTDPIQVTFAKNRLSVNRENVCTYPVSMYVSGGVARGSAATGRSFDYHPALPFFALHEAWEIKKLKNNSREANMSILFPEKMRQAENLKDAHASCQEEHAVVIIDLLAVLNYCNPHWKEQWPLLQISKDESSSSENDDDCLIL